MPSTDDLVTGVAGVTNSLDLKSLTLVQGAKIIALILIGIIAIKVILKLTGAALSKSKSMSPIKAYLVSVLKVCLWFVLILIVASSLGIEVTSLVALLSVAALAVSLALQNTLSNIAGGIMILVAKPFVPGDYVEADGISGTVSESGLSYTKFITPDNKEIFVPNSHLAAAKIINYNALGSRRVEVKVTASYDTPTETVKTAVMDLLSGISGIHQDPKPEVRLTAYNASNIEYTIRVWTDSGDYWPVYFAITEGIRDAFVKYGAVMTYDHVNVHIVEK